MSCKKIIISEDNSNLKLYKNGKVYLGKQDLWADAVVTFDDKIMFVGSEEDAKNFCKDPEVIDLKGTFMFPGFIDAHAHIMLAAYMTSGILIDAEMEEDEVLAEIKSHIENNPNKTSYFGQGYGEWYFGDLGPTKEMLDEICSDKPVLILSSGGHEGFCNSKALEIAEITKATKDPIPGFHFFHRYDDGEPTGRFAETGCIYMLFDRIEFFKNEEVKGWIEKTLAYLSELGITSIADCGAMPTMAEQGFPILHEMALSGALSHRVFGCEFISTNEEVEDSLSNLKKLHKKFNVEDSLEFNTLKIINDGTFESATASTMEPYCHDGSIVEPMLEGETLSKLCVNAASLGFDIYIHAIGDRSIKATLDAAKDVRNANCNDTRITNAHTVLVRDCDIPLFSKYNVIANTTGCWHYGTEDGRELLGDRIDYFYPMKKLIDSGARVSLGSDFPVDERGAHPMISMETAVTRQLVGEPNAIKAKPYDQAMSIEEIIDGYTVNAAYQIRKEKVLGSIEVGKYADFTVLKENPFQVDSYNIHKIQVALTIKGGKVTYADM